MRRLMASHRRRDLCIILRIRWRAALVEPVRVQADVSSAGHRECPRSWMKCDGEAAHCSAALPPVLTVSWWDSLLERLLPTRGRTPTDLARWLELPEQEMADWLKGLSPRPGFGYHMFTIPKRRGGSRIIEAPEDELKDLQRRILRRLLNPLPVHPAATGFVRKRSIVDHARPHTGRAAVVNLDLADFFPSISADRVRRCFRAIGWNREASEILTRICTREGHLPQGAPTSPALSNLVCRRLDARLTAYVQKLRQAPARYTRYADDLTFSFEAFGWNAPRIVPKNLTQLKRHPEVVRRTALRGIAAILEDEGFRIQKKKRVRIQRAHQRQTATGLVVNQQVNLPREVRRRIRAMQHRQRLGQLTAAQQRELGGWEALAAMVRKQGRAAE